MASVDEKGRRYEGRIETVAALETVKIQYSFKILYLSPN
jgi:hypothetical protein